MNGIGSHTIPNQGKTDCWITPREVIDSFDFQFDLDPCEADQQPWKCGQHSFKKREDGLIQDWSNYSRIWLNPPYGRETGRWLQKLAEHGSGIALIFARTETSMFVKHVWEHADALLFIHGRLTFFRPDGSKGKSNSGGPSVLVAYGKEMAEGLERSNLCGTFIPLNSQQ